MRVGKMESYNSYNGFLPLYAHRDFTRRYILLDNSTLSPETPLIINLGHAADRAALAQISTRDARCVHAGSG